MEITRATRALRSTINTVESDIEDISKSGSYYCTEEIARELNAIRNGLEHLRLDSTLLASDEWQESFNPRDSASFLSGATSLLDRASARLFDYKNQLKAVPMGEKQENEVREMHQWAMTTLQTIQRDLEPYTYGATDRIRQFGDHIGVTDRYTGYRSNLTRGPNQSSTLETHWMDKGAKTGFMNPAPNSTSWNRQSNSQRPHLLTSHWESVPPDNIGSLRSQVRFSNDRAPMTIFRGYRTIDSLYPRSNTFTAPGIRAGGAPNPSEHVENLRFLNGMNAVLASQVAKNGTTTPPGQDKETGHHIMTVQEKAGINTVFPGRTEYMQRYTPPMNVQRISDFLINPRPDMQIHGRPLGKAHYDPTYTEYQNRYDWPDGKKISTHPWELVE
ncbi:hypothetical protein ACOMHN_049611 [Nucella lapillus]